MSYIKAEDVLPKELIQAIQQYVDGKAIYIPSVQKKPWGSETKTRSILLERNQAIRAEFRSGVPVAELARKYLISDKSIQRIIRRMKESESEHGT
jgi:Uncharacterized conserved protein